MTPPEQTVEQLLAEIKAILEAPTPAFEAALNSPKMLSISSQSYNLLPDPMCDSDAYLTAPTGKAAEAMRREMSRLWVEDDLPTGYLYIAPPVVKPVITQGEGNVVHLSFERTRAEIIG